MATTMSMDQLVHEHNRLARLLDAPTTKRFSDRATGERRVVKLREALAARGAELEAERDRKALEAQKAAAEAQAQEVREFAARTLSMRAELAARALGQPNAPRAGSSAPRGAQSETRAASWRDPAVRAARLEKVGCRVVGPGNFSRVFRSVAAAFKELGLPMSPHIGVRMRMKEHGSVEHAGRIFEAVRDTTEGGK